MKTLMIFLVLLGITDIISTHIAFSVGLGEANPIMDGVIQHWWGIVLKLAITISVAIIFIYLQNRYQGVKPIQISLWIASIWCVGFMTFVSTWNTIQILIMRGVIQ